MRVIICGAGEVGYNIAGYLAREDNDVTVIDQDPDLITQINTELDVNGIIGHASNPEVLSQAGASEADLIIAVTNSDEVNMVACQVAHSLFNMPKKIARIREQAYLDPAWSNLFSRFHMPIDVIISPEVEVAHAINQRLRVPGTTSVVSVANGAAFLVGVICLDTCPLVSTPIKQITSLFPDLSIRISAILRDNRVIYPKPIDQMQIGDEVYFFVDARHLKRALSAFGHEEQAARKVIIIGGGRISQFLCRTLLEEQSNIRIKIIEMNEERAIALSEQMEDNIVVIHGDGLEQSILEEADIAHTETLVAATDDDETNILVALLAKKQGCQRVIGLVNKPGYAMLTGALGMDATISPRASTVATIMQNIRRGRIKAIHNLREGFAEVIEAEASETSQITNKTVGALNLPESVVIGAIIHAGKVIIPTNETIIKPGDYVIFLAAQGEARNVEKLFIVQVDLA